MNWIVRLFLVALPITAVSQAANTPDPYLYLEDSSNSQTITWVQNQNQITDHVLKADPRFAALKSDAISVLTAQDKLPAISVLNGYAYNFWQDKDHKRGIWRRLRADLISTPNPAWETLLDVDALAAVEKEDWYWSGAACLPPAYTDCMLALSRGGKDATVVREYDLTAKKFVVNGFSLPEAKSSYDWKDKDTLIVATDFGSGTLTDSGYPAQVREWKRETPLTSAKLLLQADHTEIAAQPMLHFNADSGQVMVFAARQTDFFHADIYWLDAHDRFQKLQVPRQVNLQQMRGDVLLFKLLDDWTVSGRTFTQGTLVAIPLQKMLTPVSASDVEIVFQPSASETFTDVQIGRRSVFVFSLENVRGRVTRYARSSEGKWTGQAITVPDNGAVASLSTEPTTDDLYFQYTSFLTPPTIYKLESAHAGPAIVLQGPARFDASKYVVEQNWSTSKDGTKIPYFVVHAKTLQLNSQNPTLLYGYGGFEDSTTPFYSSLYGRFWLEKGGTLVIANIRGGGEFGPRWHEAAIRQNRQLAYNDFISVAEDLIQRKVTSPAHLAIQGGSNGGLLVGAVAVERPDLFSGVSCHVPLLDMMRFTHIAAGASWIAEYGDPDTSDADFIIKYSPYQNVKPDVKYPLIYFQTVTSDDRVGPGHARKMAAKMEAQGHPVLFHETVAGGHTGTSDYESEAEDYAFDYVYLYRQVMDSKIF